MKLTRLLSILQNLNSLNEDADVELEIQCGRDDEYPFIDADASGVEVDEDGNLIIRGRR